MMLCDDCLCENCQLCLYLLDDSVFPIMILGGSSRGEIDPVSG